MDDNTETFYGTFDVDRLAKATAAVSAYVENEMGENPTEYSIYLVWFCKTLQNWKALLATSLPDNAYYEVTYNGNKSETYLDVYDKVVNLAIPDEIQEN